ncbi:MAG: 5-(carboxyamino)imidazole ribonucleotide synthase [Bacteroidota bacterium]
MKKTIINSDFKLGILGGGQLGKMLVLAAQNWDLNTWILDASADFPAASACSHFVEGSFKNYDDVYAFGKQVDVITIEIEHVNTEALLQLEAEGKIVHPRPAALNIIKDKGLQKQFYAQHGLPTSPFRLYESLEAIKAAIASGELQYPFVQKTRTAGYDGQGVALIRSEANAHKLLNAPSMVEDLVDIEKELAVQVTRNPSGQVVAFPPVEMEFNPVANLVECLICPANISKEVGEKATQLAQAAIEAYDICGLLSVEFFLSKSGEVLINEVAPRPHNSGHHTIEGNHCSQFQQHLRAVLDWPLANTDIRMPAVMVNLLGAEGHKGTARYENLRDCLAVDGAHLHLYGKNMTKPFRKMGHATVLDPDLNEARRRAQFIKDTLNIIA